MDHFRNPRNSGKMEDADGIGEVGNPADGDFVKIYIKVKNDILEEVQFQTYGCAAAIATSSMTTILATGKTLEEAKRLTRDDIAEALDGLPPRKHECSNIAVEGLHEAIKDYEKKHS